MSALETLESRLATCKDDPRHAYAQASSGCPWCRIENDGGPSFFFLTPGAAPETGSDCATGSRKRAPVAWAYSRATPRIEKA